MSECTWHCQLYPARLNRPGAAWQMQSSFTPAQHDVQPNLYFTCRIGLALRKWSCESWDSSLFLVPSSDFAGAENDRPRRWVMSQLTGLRSRTLSFNPSEVMPPCLLCPGLRAYLMWQEVKGNHQQTMLVFKFLHDLVCFKNYTLMWGKQCSPNSKCVTWSFACCGNWC